MVLQVGVRDFFMLFRYVVCFEKVLAFLRFCIPSYVKGSG